MLAVVSRPLKKKSPMSMAPGTSDREYEFPGRRLWKMRLKLSKTDPSSGPSGFWVAIRLSVTFSRIGEIVVVDRSN